MNAPVDLANLRSMTDGDAAMEKALFEEFIASFETGIATLEANVGENAAEAWRKETHALKGMALNLGAEKLGNLCKKGQEDPNADTAIKNDLVKTIRAEYEQVKRFLLAL